MHKRLLGLLGSAAMVFAACGGAASPAPASTGASASAPAASESAPAASGSAPAASGSAAAVDLTTTTYKPEAAATTGGTLVMAEWQTVSTINIFYSQSNADNEAAWPSFDGLLTVTQDLKYMPDLASNVPTVNNGDVVVNGAGMDVTWKLKPGMLWSDNQPITCQDIEATWKWVMDKAQTGLSAGTVGWEDISGVDGGTGTNCVVHFKKLYSAYLILFDPILPKHYIETVPVKDANTKLYPLSAPKKGVYSGPYVPTDIKPAAQITYAPNPNFKTIGLGDQANAHAPYLDKLIFKYYGDAPAMLAGYRAGEIDVAHDLSDSDVPTVTDIPDNEKVNQDALFSEANYYNNDSFKKKFGDTDGPAIISAIREATDVDAVIAGPMGGTVDRACSFVSPLLWFYKDEPCPKTDANDASSKLDALGWAKGADGIRAKNGTKLEVQYCTTKRPYRVDSITLIASQLAKIGIKADVDAKPALPDVFGGWNDVAPDTKCNTIHGNYDVVMHGYVSSPDPTASYLVYSTAGLPDPAPHNGQNETRISLPDMDAAWKIATTTLDLGQIKDALGTIQDIYASDKNTFELPFFNHKNLWLVSPKVHNFTGNPSTTTGNWNVADWWMGS